MKAIWHWFNNVILVLVGLLFLLAFIQPFIFKGKMAIVRSNSMAPAMPAGALALMVPVSPLEVKVGEIITFKPPWDPKVTVSHRVVEIKKEDKLQFVTRGDAVGNNDPFLVAAEDVQGKVIFSIPNVGFSVSSISKYIRNWYGFTILVAMPSAFLVFSGVRDVNRSQNIREKRLKRQRRRR